MQGDFVTVNRRRWDALAEVHHTGRGRFYDLDALVRGESSLWDAERAALERVAPDGVAGLDVLHLQCHLGADAIGFARDGARVTGLDVSPVALRHAAERAAACGVEGIRWVESDAADPPAELAGAFDLVWATIGVTSWAKDLDAWMRAAAGMLKPGGRLVLVEIHPAYTMVETLEPLRVDFPYGGGEIQFYDADGSYDDPDAKLASTQGANASWSVGEHVASAIAAGLTIEHLEEHLDADKDPMGLMDPEPDGRYRVRLHPGAAPLPILFTLIATARAGAAAPARTPV